MIPYNGIVTKEFLLGNLAFFVTDDKNDALKLVQHLTEMNFIWANTPPKKEDELVQKILNEGIMTRHNYIYYGVYDAKYYETAFSCQAYQIKDARRVIDINPVCTTFNELSEKVTAQTKEIAELRTLCLDQHKMIKQIHDTHCGDIGFFKGGAS